MLAVSDGELQGGNLHMHILDSEQRLLVTGGSRRNMEGYCKAISAQQHIGETRILDLGKTSFLLEIEGNIPHVGLDLRQGDDELMPGLVLT